MRCPLTVPVPADDRQETLETAEDGNDNDLLSLELSPLIIIIKIFLNGVAPQKEEEKIFHFFGSALKELVQK